MDGSGRDSKGSSLSRAKLGDMLDPLSYFAQSIASAATGRDSGEVGSHTKKRNDSSSGSFKGSADLGLGRSPGREDAFPAGMDSEPASTTTRGSAARASSSAASASALADPEDIRMLSGEQKVIMLQDAQVQTTAGKYVVGRLFMTTYRMVFLPPPTTLQAHAEPNPSIYTLLSIPLACIDRVEREKKSKDQRGLTNIIIWGKDSRVIRFTIQVRRMAVCVGVCCMRAHAP